MRGTTSALGNFLQFISVKLKHTSNFQNSGIKARCIQVLHVETRYFILRKDFSLIHMPTPSLATVQGKGKRVQNHFDIKF